MRAHVMSEQRWDGALHSCRLHADKVAHAIADCDAASTRGETDARDTQDQPACQTHVAG